MGYDNLWCQAFAVSRISIVPWLCYPFFYYDQMKVRLHHILLYYLYYYILYLQVKLRFLQLIGWKKSRLNRLISYISERSVSGGAITQSTKRTTRKPPDNVIITSEDCCSNENNNANGGTNNAGFLSDNSSVLTDLDQSSTIEMCPSPNLGADRNKHGVINSHQMTALYVLQGQKENRPDNTS